MDRVPRAKCWTNLTTDLSAQLAKKLQNQCTSGVIATLAAVVISSTLRKSGRPVERFDPIKIGSHGNNNPTRSIFTEAQGDWLDLLGDALTTIPGIVITVDIELLHSVPGNGMKDSSLPTAFLCLFRKLAERSTNTTVKVILAAMGLQRSLHFAGRV
jgi:hypothetical protein